ncbi:MAG: outer membrane protein assembly factor BamA [Legionellales bacterium]|nr:outer membrane protein assembly factor BamA [Legionellales bacterium]
MKNKIKINIDEGSENQIRHIRILGNKNISTSKILSEISGTGGISTTGLFTYFTEEDKYSEGKMNHALDKIKYYYQDRGYARVAIESVNVGKLPNINHVKVVIKIKEGDIYRIRDHRLTGNIAVPIEALEKHVVLKKGEKYSRKNINKIVEDITEEFNDRGYTFSIVEPQLEYYEQTKELSIDFHINPGRPIYVRRIVFVGNHKTADYVLRRELLQEEGALLSVSKVKESKRKMMNLRYIEHVQEDTQQVPGTNNQVDMIFNVSETHIAEFQGQAGISSTGFEVKLGINHYNVFGTGKRAGINFKHDSWGQNVSLDYYNPYYTESGIGRGFSAFYARSSVNQRLKSQLADFTMDSYGGSVSYNIPLTDTNSVNCGMTAKKDKIIKVGGDRLIKQYQNYVDRFGVEYYSAAFSVGWEYSNYDKFPFPTSGLNTSITTTFNYPIIRYGRYYKISTEIRYYRPLFAGVILGVAGAVKFADSYSSNEFVPFFQYFRAGGAAYEGQVRGYETASLGPKSSLREGNQAIGGNFLTNGTVALILPDPLSGKKFRTSIFYDIGNVYQVIRKKEFKRQFKGVTNSKNLRQSVGLGVEWLTPFGPIRLSFAYALKPEKGDRLSIPALSFQTGF